MRKRIVALCVSACMIITLFGGTMVHAADANQVTTPTQQEKNKDENEVGTDENEKEDIPDMQEPSDPDKVETPDVIPDENEQDKSEEPEIKPKEPEIKPEEPEPKPEEPDIKEEADKDKEVNTPVPETEAGETNIDDKDACIGIDGESEPYEVNPYLRASTIPGTWIQAADGRWWYKHSDGTYTKNGWEYINGKWYYFDGSGWMMTGWINLGGKWYYLKISSPDSGSMLTGWQPLGGKWYYLKESSPDMGLMLTGWQYIGGEWYYFKVSSPDSGSMLTGWQPLGGKWYFLFDDGVMNNQNMYDEKYGHPRTLHFASSGEWLFTVSLCGWNAVDGGKHLDWGGETKYTSYVKTAAKKWNAYKSGVIREDSIKTIQDVTFSDFYEKSNVWGDASPNGKIRLNTYLMDADKSTYNDKLNTVMHEFGHTLGLGHNDPEDVMAKSSDVVTLTSNDKHSYDEAYKTY